MRGFSLSRFSLARLCGAIARAERLNSIVDCGYKTLNLKYPPLPKKNALPLSTVKPLADSSRKCHWMVRKFRHMDNIPAVYEWPW